MDEIEPLAGDETRQFQLLADGEPGDIRLDRPEVRSRRRVRGKALAAQKEDVLVLAIDLRQLADQ